MRRFQWTPEREQALMLARTGHYTQAEIAARLGVSRRTIAGWARRPAWKARYQELVAISFAEWERQVREDNQRRAAEFAARSSSYTPRPRGTRSHRTRWYQQGRTQHTETPEAPIRSRPPSRSAEDMIADLQRRQMLAAQPRTPWWG